MWKESRKTKGWSRFPPFCAFSSTRLRHGPRFSIGGSGVEQPDGLTLAPSRQANYFSVLHPVTTCQENSNTELHTSTVEGQHLLFLCWHCPAAALPSRSWSPPQIRALSVNARRVPFSCRASPFPLDRSGSAQVKPLVALPRLLSLLSLPVSLSLQQPPLLTTNDGPLRQSACYRSSAAWRSSSNNVQRGASSRAPSGSEYPRQCEDIPCRHSPASVTYARPLVSLVPDPTISSVLAV
ncbi:hypothetical protein VTN00DRAFT_1020 [Thermoascus crustaceus]|uniref:uncharacterized protein n=1 Tax=Thermoascus crustaceus TaxID=5088 RepID=UPI003744827C